MKTTLEVHVAFKNQRGSKLEMPNLINDGGLDMLADDYVANIFKYIQTGDGTRINKRTSTTTYIYVNSSSIVEATADFFLEADVGRVLRYGIAQEYMGEIEAYINPKRVRIKRLHDDSVILGKPSYPQVLYVEETDLDNPLDITSICEANENGSTVETDPSNLEYILIKDKRTFDLGTVAGSAFTRTEFGWGPTNSIGSDVFGRIYYPAGVTWNIGEDVLIEVTVIRKFNTSDFNGKRSPIAGIDAYCGYSCLLNYTDIQSTAFRSTIQATDGASVIGADADSSMFEGVLTDGVGKFILSEDSTSLLLENSTQNGGRSLTADWTTLPYRAGTFEKRLLVTTEVDTGWRSKKWRSILILVGDTYVQYKLLWNSNVVFNGVLENISFLVKWGRG